MRLFTNHEDAVGGHNEAAFLNPCYRVRLGRVLRLVVHGETGYVAEPNAKDVAEAIDQLYTRPARAGQLDGGLELLGRTRSTSYC